MNETLLTPDQAARYLNLSPRTLAGWRTRGGGPSWVAISARCCRYRPEDLDAFLAERVRVNTSKG